MLGVCAVLAQGCAHMTGDFPDRMPRGTSVVAGPGIMVDTARGFVTGDEFDVEIRSETEVSRALPPAVSRWFPLLPDGLNFARYALRAHVRVDQAQRGVITTATLVVASGAVSVDRDALPSITPGRTIVVAVLDDANRPLLTPVGGALTEHERAVLTAAFSRSPLLFSLDRWFGRPARRRVGEQWQVGVERHGDETWLGDPITSDLMAHFERVAVTEDSVNVRLQSWSDGPVVARQVGDNGTWQRRRVTREAAAELERDGLAPFSTMTAHETVEFATPATLITINAIAAPRTEYIFDSISMRRTIVLRAFSRAASGRAG